MPTTQTGSKKIIGIAIGGADTEFSDFIGGTVKAFLERFEVQVLETERRKGKTKVSLCKIGDKLVPIWKRSYQKVVVRHYVGRDDNGEPIPPMTVGSNPGIIYDIRKF